MKQNLKTRILIESKANRVKSQLLENRKISNTLDKKKRQPQQITNTGNENAK